jgi:hypothetical protein
MGAVTRAALPETLQRVPRCRFRALCGAGGSLPEEQEAISDPARYWWGNELFPDGPGATVVTETFNCSRSPEDLRKASGTARDGGTP